MFSRLGSITRSGRDCHVMKSNRDKCSKGNNKRSLVELKIEIESPPCVLYGCAAESVGALLSGLVVLKVWGSSDTHKQSYSLHNTDNKTKELFIKATRSNSIVPDRPTETTNVYVTKILLRLVQKVTYGKPFCPNSSAIISCSKCKNKEVEVSKWEVLSERSVVKPGKHPFFFSCLVPGHLPPTCSLGSNGTSGIRYELIAEADYELSNSDSTEIKSLCLSMPITVTRSLTRNLDRNLLRVFPPTDVTAIATLPQVFYPKSSFTLQVRLNGVRRWRMKRLTWRIDEKTRVLSNACPDHMHKLKSLETEVKERYERNMRSSVKPINRTPDMGPQVTVSVYTDDDIRFGQNSSTSRTENVREELDQEEDGGSNSNSDLGIFIHPNDHVMRQELNEQTRLRYQQMEKRGNHETSIYTEEVRTLATQDISSGWKSDFTDSGRIELFIDVDCMKLNSGIFNSTNSASTSDSIKQIPSAPANVAYDIEDPSLGIFVSHLLMIEVVIAEEIPQYYDPEPINQGDNISSPISKQPLLNIKKLSHQGLAELSSIFVNRTTNTQRKFSDDEYTYEDTDKSKKAPKIVKIPTGAARVLRMQFRLYISERPDIGISWGDEIPPTYHTVKYLSPPNYSTATNDFKIAPITVNTPLQDSSDSNILIYQSSQDLVHNNVTVPTPINSEFSGTIDRNEYVQKSFVHPSD